MKQRGKLPDGVLPWTRSCFVCGEENPHGLRLKARIQDGRIVLDYAPRPADLGWQYIVHGGIATTLLDEVMTWAAILARRAPCVAAELTVRLKKPIRIGQQLRVEGEVTEDRSRLVLTQGVILDEQGQVMVTASGKHVPMPPEQVALCEKDFVPGSGTLDLAALMGTSDSPA
jgi:uncharacterized protein (TIGR00369 family)